MLKMLKAMLKAVLKAVLISATRAGPYKHDWMSAI
jgi:hypothetical protein